MKMPEILPPRRAFLRDQRAEVVWVACSLVFACGICGCGELTPGRSTATANAERAIVQHALPITAVACAADGSRMLTADNHCGVQLWNAESGELLIQFSCAANKWGATTATCMAFLPDLRRAVIQGEALLLGDLERGQIISRFATDPERQVNPGMASIVAARCMALSADGQVLVAGRTDNRVEVWNLESGDLLAEFQEIKPDFENGDRSRGAIVAVGITPDGATVAAVDGDFHVWYWDLPMKRKQPGGRQVHVVQRIETASAAFSADCSRLLVCHRQYSDDRQQLKEAVSGRPVDSAYEVSVWDGANDKPLRGLSGLRTEVVSGLCISPDGRRAAACLGKSLVVWNVESGAELTLLSVHRGTVSAGSFSSDGRWLVTGGQDGSAHRWRLPDN
jgi:WD40 repeat protein